MPDIENHSNAFSSLFGGDKIDLDSNLSSLFNSSAGPIKPRDRSKKKNQANFLFRENPDSELDLNRSSANDDENYENDEHNEYDEPQSDEPNVKTSRKRKREARSQEEEASDRLESRALQRLADDEPESEEVDDDENEDDDAAGVEVGGIESQYKDENLDSTEAKLYQPPLHESITNPESNPDIEKASRTVFLGNISVDAIRSKSSKKTLLAHLSSFLPDISSSDNPHKLESLRFRSTAFGTKLPKKAAFAKKELMDATSHCTNAYAVYSTKLACKESIKRLNGTIVLDRHLRVDHVVHPAPIDHKRCVFVGNLDFVDDDTTIREDSNSLSNQDEKKKQKPRAPADVEEGLWRAFGKAGTVESVRVIRDQKTRVGKGFAYVQFINENAVEQALLMNEKKFPPMLPRKLRVMRAKHPKKINALKEETKANQGEKGGRQSVGRNARLLGRAGASQIKRVETQATKSKKPRIEKEKLVTIRPPEDFVFEGVRASSKDGKIGLKFGNKRKSNTNSQAPTTNKKSKSKRTSRSQNWKKRKS